MLSSSDVVYNVTISWNYILLSVTDNFGLGKWAKMERLTTANEFELRIQRSIEDYTRKNSESIIIRQNSMGFSYRATLEVARYDDLLHRFSIMFQRPLIGVENWKEKSSSHFRHLFKSVILITLILTDTRRSKNFQKSIIFCWKNLNSVLAG